MYAKVTVSLPEELLAAIDADALREGISRSGVVQEAAETYLAGKAAAAEERYRRGMAAVAAMREMAARPKTRDPRPSLEILRELRANDGFVTPLPDEDGDL